MAKYDELRPYQTARPEQKLAILRSQMITPLAAVRGYAALLKTLDFDSLNNFPQDFKIWVDSIAEAADDLQEILETLTGFQK